MNIKQTEVAKFIQFSMKTMRSKSRAWKIGLCGHWAELLVTGVSNGRRQEEQILGRDAFHFQKRHKDDNRGKHWRPTIRSLSYSLD